MADLNFLREMELWLLDMDGTIYLDDHLIEGAENFVNTLIEKQKRFLFLTNNSSKSVRTYIQKLHTLGLEFVSREHVYTSGQAAASYILKTYPKKKVYLVGTSDLQEEFERSGIPFSDEPELVVLGFDTTLTYQKLWRICDLVRAGLPYIATHADVNCPVKDGFMPDIGSVIAFIKASTGKEPDVIIGKPNPPILEEISCMFATERSKMVMVGDRLYTDIAMGGKGIRTVLVLSGETGMEDLHVSPFCPDGVVSSVKELVALI